MRRIISLSALLAAAIWVQVGVAQSVQPATNARQMHGDGGWKTHGKPALAAQHWHIDATRGSDDSIRGRATLGGSPLAAAGNVVGHVSGQSVSGDILDDNGQAIASFTGTMSATGINGTYTDRTGETGAWSWDGPLPQQ